MRALREIYIIKESPLKDSGRYMRANHYELDDNYRIEFEDHSEIVDVKVFHGTVELACFTFPADEVKAAIEKGLSF